jgi:hypothetical protein
MTSGKENRRSFRIFESIHLSYEIISDREFHEGLERRKIRLGINDGVSSRVLDLDARLSERLYILRAESPVTADCISLLNEKLSVVIDQLPEMRKAKSSLTRTEPQICEIGADGMLFGTDTDMPPGTRLALRFLLRSNNRYVETFSQVQRHAEPPEEDGGRFAFGVAVEFLGMQPSQKEIIIQHLFSRECETLRLRKRQNDSATESTGAANGAAESQ